MKLTNILFVLLFTLVIIASFSCSHALDWVGNPDAPELTLKVTCTGTAYNLSWDASSLPTDTTGFTTEELQKDYSLFSAYFIYQGEGNPYEDLYYIDAITGSAGAKNITQYTVPKSTNPLYFRVAIIKQTFHPNDTTNTSSYEDDQISTWGGGTETECPSN